jgi:hypothetical protein
VETAGSLKNWRFNGDIFIAGSTGSFLSYSVKLMFAGTAKSIEI